MTRTQPNYYTRQPHTSNTATDDTHETLEQLNRTFALDVGDAVSPEELLSGSIASATGVSDGELDGAMNPSNVGAGELVGLSVANVGSNTCFNTYKTPLEANPPSKKHIFFYIEGAL